MSNTINNANEIQVINNNGELVVSSRQVALNFGKRHADVLENINEILKTENSVLSFFHESHYKVENNNKSYPEYLMNRDGFCLLVMGFTGKEALTWKLKYIEAFNAMEKKLKELSAPQTLDDTLNADVLFLIASKWKADSDKRKELEVRVAELEAQIKTQQEVQPVISEATKVAIKEAKVEQHRLYTVTEIARECGFPDARTLNLALNDLGIQYKIKSHWKIAEKYEELGYAITVSPYANTPFLKWTLKGKEFIRQQLKEAHLL